MPQFIFAARDQEGKPHSGKLDAADREAAMDALAEKGLIVTKLDRMKTLTSGLLGIGGLSVKGEELMAFTHQLATMIDAGMPLKKTLDVLASDAESPGMRQILLDISAGIGSGDSLSRLFRKYPRVFSDVYVSMVSAGESTGDLGMILHRLAGYIESSENLKKKLQAALFYPIAVLGFAFCLVTLFLIYGVGALREIYSGFNTELPIVTRAIIYLADLITANWFLIIPVLMVIIYIIYRLSITEKGVFFWDTIKLGIPQLGSLFRRLAIARFANTWSVLVTGGVPILSSLELVAGSAGNKVMEKAVREAINKIREGKPISLSLKDSGVFTNLATSMISAGEDTGTLGAMLARVSTYYESEVDIVLKALTGLVEPIVLIGVGIVVGIMIIALGLPIVNLVEVML
jgi:type IV pilus assembly protein PilC